jgi:hypothetical protein
MWLVFGEMSLREILAICALVYGLRFIYSAHAIFHFHG